MGKGKLICFVLMGLIFSGCAIRYPVIGEISSTSERFTGTAVSSMMSGKLKIKSSKGVECEGSYIPPQVLSEYSVAVAKGNVVCMDGRIGSWTATGTIAEGLKGTGLIDGKKFTFYAGNSI